VGIDLQHSRGRGRGSERGVRAICTQTIISQQSSPTVEPHAKSCGAIRNYPGPRSPYRIWRTSLSRLMILLSKFPNASPPCVCRYSSTVAVKRSAYSETECADAPTEVPVIFKIRMQPRPCSNSAFDRPKKLSQNSKHLVVRPNQRHS